MARPKFVAFYEYVAKGRNYVAYCVNQDCDTAIRNLMLMDRVPANASIETEAVASQEPDSLNSGVTAAAFFNWLNSADPEPAAGAVL